MRKVKSKVTINKMAIKKIEQASKTALAQTAAALHTEIVQAQVVPRDKGTLQNEAFFQDNSQLSEGIVKLVHSTPYARRLYYHPEYNFNQTGYKDDKGYHEGNPNAKGKWFEDWCKGGKNEKFVQTAYKMLLERLL